MFVRPVTVQVVGVASTPTVVVHPILAGDDETTYPVIALPPVSVGAIHETVASLFPGVPVTKVGAPGTPAGVTRFDATDALDVP